ncbi:MAG: PQQ-dependent dehydrogenase, methanol/ethanol family [Steroidobacteraceae bacterium]
MRRSVPVALCAALLPLLLMAAPKPAQVDTARLLKADSEPGQWLAVGRTYDEQRFSPLTKIDAGNVSQLGLAWHYDLDTNRGQEASPIVIDGVLYVTSAWSKLFAFNARTGKLLWKHDPQVPGAIGIKGCCDVVNRGVAAWKGRIYLGAYDGRLIALDAKTGKVVWSVQTTDPSRAYTITGAPRIANGKVIIGNAGSEIGVRGYVSAYDAADGRLLWRFFTIPGDPSKPYETEQLRAAAATWTGDLYWKLGGATVWDGIVYEPRTNLVYFGTANGTPWVAEVRSPQGGDNLFTNSIVAVDADTGRYAWHYQVTPAETWDYDATSPLMLADLAIDGVMHRALLQVSKNGFFYALDAVTGKLLRARNYTAVSWATGIDMRSGRPIEVPEARFGKTGKAVVVQPGGQGAHSWHPMAFSRRTGLVYTPVVETSQGFAPDPNYTPREGAANAGTGRAPANVYEGVHADVPRTSRAYLIAWDPVDTREVWRSELRGTIASGALATAGGLVFQGAQRGEFSAYRDSDGMKLWSTDPQTGVVAAPVSYLVDGEQYIAVLAGYGTRDYYAGNNSRLLVYKLGGKSKLPPPAPPPPPRQLNPPQQFGSAAQIERGARVYNENCTMCHDTAYGNRGLFPDLRYSPLINSADAFRSVVIDGVLTPRGMVSFRERFGAEDAEAVRAYITQRAHQAMPVRPAQ